MFDFEDWWSSDLNLKLNNGQISQKGVNLLTFGKKIVDKNIEDIKSELDGDFNKDCNQGPNLIWYQNLINRNENEIENEEEEIECDCLDEDTALYV